MPAWRPTRPVVDHDRVVDLLTSAEAYLADVRRFRDEVDRERFLADRGEQYRIQFPLQQAIQICIDLAAHVLADTPGRRPGTLAGLFAALAEREVIDEDLATRLGAMARFRNLLVHQYAEIDATRVWQIVANDLGDVEQFLEVIASALEAE